MSDENVPIDATRVAAEEVVDAAMEWRFKQGNDPVLTRVEWRLYEAMNRYGDKWKGVVGK